MPLAVLAFSCALPAARGSVPPIAHDSEIVIPGSFAGDFSASNGITYRLKILLPKDYDARGIRRYPVLYVIPGDSYGVFFSQIAQFLSAGDIEPIIVVGIDFPPDDSYSMDLPTAGPDPHWTVPENRGAERFLKIVTDEIKPFVDARFPTDPRDSGIIGHSLGGFFALYAMMHAPDVFRHVYASSPSFIWQDFELLREARALATTRKDLAVRAFVDVGEQEEQDGRFETFSKAMASLRFPSFDWHARMAPGETHRTVALADGADALYAIYGPRPRQVPKAELHRLTGRWRLSDGSRFQLFTRGDRLFARNFRNTENETVELLSSRPGEWFIRYLRYRFDVSSDRQAHPLITVHLHDTPGPNGTVRNPVLIATKVE